MPELDDYCGCADDACASCGGVLVTAISAHMQKTKTIHDKVSGGDSEAPVWYFGPTTRRDFAESLARALVADGWNRGARA